MDFPNSHSYRERMIAKGELLAQFLNVAKGLPKEARVLRLRKSCLALQELLPGIVQAGSVYQVVNAPSTSLCDLSSNKNARRLLAEINRGLDRYRFRRTVPSIVFLTRDEPPTLQTHAVPIRPVPFSKRERGSTIEETGAVELLLELVECGALDRVRQCEFCKNWFMQGRTDKKNCGPGCIRKRFNQKLGKQKRKQYVRQYRKNDKAREKRELREARRR